MPDKEHKNAAYEAVTSCKSFCEAEECHKKNFAELYSRVSLNLGGDTDDCDNERRLAEFDGTDKGMYELWNGMARKPKQIRSTDMYRIYSVCTPDMIYRLTTRLNLQKRAEKLLKKEVTAEQDGALRGK